MAPGTGSSRIAAAWYSSTSFSVNIDLTDGQTHDVSLYLIDWDSQGRSEQVQVTNAVSGAVLSTQTVSSFAGGTYLTWALTGDVVITFTRLAGPNAVLSGLFFDPVPNFASFGGTDTTTEGNWIGVYGSQGYNIITNAVDYPSYANVVATGETDYTWAATTTDPRGLEMAPGTGSSRVAAAWESTTSFSVAINLTDGLTHEIALYLVDWDSMGRNEQIQIKSVTTGMVLDTETVSSFSGGEYLKWAISGDVVITFTDLAGPNAVLSGLFFDPSVPAAATYIDTDAKTQGNWSGVYGSQGYNIIANSVNYPDYATVTPTGKSNYTWAASTTDPRALEMAPGTGSSRIAAAWYSTTSFSVNIDLTDGQTHDISLYLLDWDSQGRREQIQITNESTGAVLNTQTVSSFTGGVYLTWAISGDVVFTFTRLAGPNAVVSGIFFDPPSSPPAAMPASLVTSSNATLAGPLGAPATPAITGIGTLDFTSADTASVLPTPAPIPPSDKLIYDVALDNVASDQRRLV